jgi:hypothetical protein
MSNYPFDTFPLTKRIGIVNPVANLDARYGPWRTYNDALTAFSPLIREVGLTVGVSGVDGITEYWYKDGILNNDLVIKTVPVNLTEYLQLTGGTISGNLNVLGQILSGGTNILNFIGATGLTGATGTGATGPQGNQGGIGLTGSTGLEGSTGPIGATGSSGIQGNIGATGASGIQGNQGATGASGLQGIRGATGSTGIQGNIGATGASGVQGIQGATGASGQVGTQGVQGATGASGIQGLVGSTGTQGATGASGIQGLVGSTGTQGATGASGIQGATGLTGTPGSQGATGASGIQGNIGATGASGLVGFTGATGASGLQGATGNQGATGASGIRGATGASGLQGIQGFAGTTGPSGFQGATGIEGPAGTSVTISGSLALTPGNEQTQLNNPGNSWYFPVKGTGVIDTNTGNLWIYDGTIWNNVGQIVGPPGATGIGLPGSTGVQGLVGATGLIGATGASGIQGLRGSTGSTGLDGQPGATGLQGIPGLPGATGASGVQGNIGATGASGIQGTTGPVGPIGATGASGIQGTTGPVGPIGATGASGVQGNIGATGASGVQGNIGATGASGLQGNIGATGASGVQGNIGATGASGLQGTTGIGTPGATGASGIQGLPGATGTEFVFTTDLTASFGATKSFGKYLNGDIIPATGRTPSEVIQLALVEPIAPEISLTTSTTQIQFNQSAISNVLNYNYTIKSLGASVASVSLDWRRNNTGGWTNLSPNTTPGQFTHSLTDPLQFSGANNASGSNTQPFNYRYIVRDTFGASATATVNITPQTYQTPTITFSVAGINIVTPETSLERERGNVGSIISGSITRNRALVNLTSYQLQFSVNSGSYTNIGSPVPITAGVGSVTIPSTTHNPTSDITANSIAYRIQVIDAYQTFINSAINSAASTINYKLMIYHGHSSSAPLNSTAVRNLTATGGRLFLPLPAAPNNLFILNTGNVNRIYTAAMPVPNVRSLVRDLDSLNANITTDYVNNPFNVTDAGGTNISYNVYTMTQAIPYSSNHRHEITVT